MRDFDAFCGDSCCAASSVAVQHFGVALPKHAAEAREATELLWPAEPVREANIGMSKNRRLHACRSSSESF